MKTKIFLLIAIALFLGCGQTKTQSSDEEIEKMLKKFYTEYITKCSQQPSVFVLKEMDVIKQKYCTVRFLNEINEQDFDFDPFLNAQDCDVEWLKSLSVRKDSDTDKTYKISYQDAYSGDQVIIRLIIIKDDDSFKIDGIL